MAIIKCKMCGGDLELLEDSSVCECEYCGTKQTVPKADDEKKLKLFERANRLRTACEFDKAAGVYETIVADFDQEAEAYWGLILCKFGIEYVDDPATKKKIPTCHRSSFDSLMDDPNFEMVMECADPIARRVYREEAKAIEELRRGIIEVSSKEEPYDVFISYKELAEDGQRTLDSVIAQDIYTELTDRGCRVFFSRISLEDKLGVEYEPYIFAALNSAKVMLVVGTDYDYFNAVWVKNEWSRFLALIARGEKKTLIPVFKGIDAYDMPKEFSKLAAQDMGKVGAMQDLVRGVEKIIGRKQPEPAAQPQQVIQQIVQGGGPNVTALLKRGRQALEDGDWDKAGAFFDQMLSMDAENAEAFFGLALAESKSRDPEDYVRNICSQPVEPEMRRFVPEKDIIRKKTEKIAASGCYEEEEIAAVFDVEVSYPLILPGARRLTEKIRSGFPEKNMKRAFLYAQGETKQTLEKLRRALFAELDGIIRDAEDRDSSAIKHAKADYDAQVERAVERLASEKKREQEEAERQQQEELALRERQYQESCRMLEQAPDIETLWRAEARFTYLGEYKDSRKKASECKLRQRIERLSDELNSLREKHPFWIRQQLNLERELTEAREALRRLL